MGNRLCRLTLNNLTDHLHDSATRLNALEYSVEMCTICTF
jgi:hypothetical protein